MLVYAIKGDKVIKKIDNIRLLSCLIFLTPFWYGLFYEYTAFFVGILFVILFYKITKEKKQVVFLRSKNFYIYTILICFYLIVSIWAVDKEIAIEGFLKYLPGVFYFLLLMQFEKEDKQKLMYTIPISGAIMSIVSCLLGLIPTVKEQFFSENGRLVGFFQYSNTFALFLLIGIVVIANKDKSNIKDKIMLVVLIVGILLTGSRTTFILTLLYGIYQIIKRRKNKKQVIFLTSIILVCLCIVMVLNISALSRLLKISLEESTLVGRAIYILDGIRILAKYPFGLGYMGYSYVYPEIQTADYTVKFIHNEFLQQALDTGIISMLLLTYLFLSNIFAKKTSIRKRELLIIILIHIMFDFDMQFLAIHLIFVMLLEETEGREVYYNVSKSKIANIGVTAIFAVVLGYFCIASWADKLGNYKLALDLLNNKTSANLQKIEETQNIQEAEKIADTILKNNKYVANAYKVKASCAYNKGEWKQMLENQIQVIKLRKYNIEEYEEYVLMISGALDKTVTQGKQKETDYLIENLQKINELLDETKSATSSLAYKIADKPELELNKEIKEYLEKLKQ